MANPAPNPYFAARSEKFRRARFNRTRFHMSPKNREPQSGAENRLRHVAIIMDGNGRWARERGKGRIYGHAKGAEKVGEIMQAANEIGVEYLTLYAFSSENWNRPKDEVSGLMRLLAKTVRLNRAKFIKNKTRLMTIGDISALPKFCRRELDLLKEQTSRFAGRNLVLALNYGSRDEVVRAVRKIAAKSAAGEISPEGVTWQTLSENLDTAGIPDPDLLIRTSGELRLSNYLLLQSAYTELYFSKQYWPDFSREEFIAAVNEYRRRERRYGLTGEQVK